MSLPNERTQDRTCGLAFLRGLALTALAVAAFLALFQLITIVLRLVPEPIGPNAELFVEGARLTLLLTIVSGVLGLVLGLLAGLAKLSANPVVRAPAAAYVWLVRGTPLLVQILFVYYGLPEIFPWLTLNDFLAAAVALGLNVGAYNAEVVRAGILAVPRGQTEAARSLGLTGLQTLAAVVVPQAVRITVPPLVNNLVALLKDSSLASVIGLLELTLTGNRVRAESFAPVPVLATVAAVYLTLTTALTFLTSRLERRLARGRSR